MYAIDEYIYKLCYSHTMEYYSAVKKDELLIPILR